MSEYLANRLNSLYSDFNYEDVEYDTVITLHCEIHGTYNKTVTQILYKNPNCPICTRINKNKRLSEIGKTKVGELNSFYGHHHTDEVRKKMSHPLSEETKQKISNTVKSEECQNRTKQTCLKKYGVEHYTNKEKAVTTCIERYGGIGNQSEIIRQHIQHTCQKKYNVKNVLCIPEIREKGRNTMLQKYGVDNIFKHPDVKEKARKAYTGHINRYESILYDICKQAYSGPIKQNCRTAIKHYELDLYFEELKLAIEFNGNYWHSYPRKDKMYHLNKALACRENNIRLISIYEFEDFDTQCKLLVDLLNGIDNYPKQDFNKNNLIKEIPDIYPNETEKGTVYTIGKIMEVI